MKHQIANVISTLERKSKIFWGITGLTFIALLGVLDFLTGYELSFSLFYLIPISMVAWYISGKLGVVASVICAIIWLLADYASGHIYSYPTIYFWNSGMRLGFFLIVTLLLSELKGVWKHAQDLSRTDYLTGAVNARFFLELAQGENNRAHRYNHPFTLAYIDLDNFKSVNDRFGHHVGDEVLRSVVNSIKQKLRKTDVIGRLGGDEFSILLPETGPEAGQVVINKIHLTLLDEMRRNGWPVTFSIGALTCVIAPQTIDEVIWMADELMYTVKNDAKSGVRFSTYAG